MQTERKVLQSHSPAPHAGGYIGDPYPLDVCVVSDEPLGPSAITYIYTNAPSHLQEGRHLRFCCKECLAKFQQSPQQYLQELDARIAALQKPIYPLTHCVFDITAKIDPAACEDVVYGNRLYRLSTSTAKLNFSKSLKRWVAAFEKELIALQRSKYPLTQCVVTDAPLPEKPVDIIVGYRLVRLADDAAVATFYADPYPYLKKLEAAHAAKSGDTKSAGGESGKQGAGDATRR